MQQINYILPVVVLHKVPAPQLVLLVHPQVVLKESNSINVCYFFDPFVFFRFSYVKHSARCICNVGRYHKNFQNYNLNEVIDYNCGKTGDRRRKKEGAYHKVHKQ